MKTARVNKSTQTANTILKYKQEKRIMKEYNKREEGMVGPKAKMKIKGLLKTSV
jgi:hypothetical protein